MKSLQLRYGVARQEANLASAPASRQFHNKRRKRRITLIKKAHELATRCDAHVYVLVRYGGRYYTYKSLDNPAWPPSQSDICASYPLPIQLTSSDLLASEHSVAPGASCVEHDKVLPDIPDQSPFDDPVGLGDGSDQEMGADSDDERTPCGETGSPWQKVEVPCVFRP